MNIQFILSLVALLKGKNNYKTTATVLHTVGTAVASLDKDSVGVDDEAAGIIVSVADAIDKYGDNTNNLEGGLVDAAISGLQRYKAEREAAGKIHPKSA
jgi:hypothetical protein